MEKVIDLRGHEQICSLYHAVEYASQGQYTHLIFGFEDELRPVPEGLICSDSNPLRPISEDELTKMQEEYNSCVMNGISPRNNLTKNIFFSRN